MGNGLEELLLACQREKATTIPQAATTPGEPPDKERSDHKHILLNLVAGYECFRSQNSKAFVYDGKHTMSVRSGSLRNKLILAFVDKTGNMPSSSALGDVLSYLEAKGLESGKTIPVFTRVGRAGDKLYLDLADEQGTIVEIDGKGWEIVTDAPVRFRRSPNMLPLPMPIKGGNISLLRSFVRCSDEEFKLIVAFMLSTLRPDLPFPVLLINGEHGSAKSTLTTILKKILDPTVPMLRSLPGSERDLAVAAGNGHLFAFNNISVLSNNMSDAICCLSTGGGSSNRALYSDEDETVFESKKPVILNGIDDFVTRPDLLNRTVLVHLYEIPPEQRKSEKTFWEEFEPLIPAILGALLDGLSTAIRQLPSVKLAAKPRMADFAEFATASESSFGWEPGSFLAAFSANQDEGVEIAIENEPLAVAVRQMMNDTTLEFIEGNATYLFSLITEQVDEKTKRSASFPTPRSLKSNLLRVAPNLRKVGIDINARPNANRTIKISKLKSA